MLSEIFIARMVLEHIVQTLWNMCCFLDPKEIQSHRSNRQKRGEKYVSCKQRSVFISLLLPGFAMTWLQFCVFCMFRTLKARKKRESKTEQNSPFLVLGVTNCAFFMLHKLRRTTIITLHNSSRFPCLSVLSFLWFVNFWRVCSTHSHAPLCIPGSEP